MVIRVQLIHVHVISQEASLHWTGVMEVQWVLLHG